MVMRLAETFSVAGSNPGQVNTAPPPTVGQSGFKPATKDFTLAVLPFDRRLSNNDLLPHYLVPLAPLKKMISSFRG